MRREFAILKNEDAPDILKSVVKDTLAQFQIGDNNNQRVVRIYINTMMVRLQKNEVSGLLTDKYLYFFPDLRDALTFMPSEEAIKLFESDPGTLARDITLFRFFAHQGCTLYDNTELRLCLVRYLTYLKGNEKYILADGQPKARFTQSYFVDSYLSDTYSTFLSNRTVPIPMGPFILPEANDVALDGSPALSEDDNHKVGQLRPSVLQIKMDILKEFIRYPELGLLDVFWHNIIGHIRNHLSTEDLFYLLDIDKRYSLKRTENVQYGDMIANGGMTSVFYFLFHLISEISLGHLAQVRAALADLIVLDSNGFPLIKDDNYFSLALEQQKQVGIACSTFESRLPLQADLWRRYRYELFHCLKSDITNTLIYQASFEGYHFIKSHPLIASKTLVSSQNEFRSTSDAFFIFNEDTCCVKYEGNEIHIKKYRGLEYIFMLLRNPAEDIDVQTLLSSTNTYFGKHHTNEVSSGQAQESLLNEMEQDGLQISMEDGVEIVDREAIKQYKRELEKLEEKRLLAEDAGDYQKASSIKSEMLFIAKQVQGAGKKSGGQRMVGSSADKARKSIRYTINHAIKAIRKQSPALADHFSKSITFGYRLHYKPFPPVYWYTE